MADAYEDDEGNGWIKLSAMVKNYGVEYRRWRRANKKENFFSEGTQYVPYDEYNEYKEILEKDRQKLVASFRFDSWRRLRKLALEWRARKLTVKRTLANGTSISMPYVGDEKFQAWVIKAIEGAVSGENVYITVLHSLMKDELIHPLWVRYFKLCLLKNSC